MQKLTAKYQHNKLLFSGIVFFIIGSVLGIILEDENVSSRMVFFDNFILNFVLAVLAMPVLEELIFRGLFYKKKYKILFYLGSLLFIILSKNYYLIVLLLLAAYLLEMKITLFRESSNLLLIAVLVTAIFALIHYQISDFNALSTSVFVLSQFGLGLILIWIVLNFSLKKAIITHALYNFILLLPVFIFLEFPSSEPKHIIDNGYELTYKQIAVSEKEMSFEWKDSLPKASNMSMEDFYEIVCNDSFVETKKVPVKYSFEIEKKDKNAPEFDCKILNNLIRKMVKEEK